MAEAFLQILIENITSFLEGELSLLFGFENEFENLSSRFSTIQAVLEDAQMKQLKDKAIKNWRAYIILYFLPTPNDRECNNILVWTLLGPGSILTEPQVYGRDKEEDEIVKILINYVSDAQQLSVLPIVGMGGLGKTTLSQMVFNDQRVIQHFDPKIWVCVSDNFEEKKLIKAIVESAEGRPLLGDMDLAPLQKKLQELLNGKRYLLVLDDVWNEDQEKWDCWLLFMQRALGHQEEINPNLVVIGKEIVKKCGGVPLAAKTLGGILRFKREEREWEHVRDSEIWKLPQDESSILPALQLSYHHLPLDLRQCFTYCAVFPKDTEMEKENLISLWMAHGFLLSKGNLELEYVGNEVWNELYLRSFFQEIEVKSSNTYFKMHDLIHDLATSLFSASTSSSNIRQVSVKYYPYMMSIGLAEIVSPYSPPLLQNFVSLRVLNLSYTELELEQLPSSIGDLVHLRYLNLSSNLRIRSLPKQLCKLQNLQTLDLHDCWSLSCLPKQTSTLGSLRNLLFDGCPLTCMPPRIGSLTCLKTLSYFVVGRKKSYQLGELRNLDLHGSISITNLERVKKHTEAKEANLSAKANLHSLTIIGFRGFRLPDWMNHSVLKRVVSIRIEGCENCSCLPPFGDLPCLESLVLANGSGEVEYLEEDDVSTRRWFPSLRKLSIWDFCNLKGLLKKGGEEQFPVLEEIELHIQSLRSYSPPH
ncbi:putative disease resistance protein RGA1 [Solanum tuberosum]|uniref:Disease resistance protein RGA1 n=1 Tax=Solanum tuberosum TaxID=4113 RepID=M1BJ65_SOLTU|nr:PREDICTED: putative disease resistance protein RGA1 [Solanum tuberosum]